MSEAPTLSRETRRETTRVCGTCNTARPLVLFPRKKNGALRERCQLCRDTGAKRRPKDLIAIKAAAAKARRMRSKMERANEIA